MDINTITFIEIPNWTAVPYYKTRRFTHRTDESIKAILAQEGITIATVWCWNTDGKDGQIRNHAVKVGKVEDNE